MKSSGGRSWQSQTSRAGGFMNLTNIIIHEILKSISVTENCAGSTIEIINFN